MAHAETPEPPPEAAQQARTKRAARAVQGPRPEEIRLTGDRIIVDPPEDGERTSRGGLLIPATAAPAPKRCVWARVVLVGPDVRSVASGDRVLFLPQAGLEVELRDEEYVLLRERDVQAVAKADDGSDRDVGLYL
jgi:chaperonin GroES